MSLLSPSVRLLGVVLVATAAVAACSSSNDSTGPTINLSGNYILVSFETPPNPVLTPPVATGALVLTTTRYKATINILGQAPIIDSGTYTATATELTQTSDVLPIQSTGTYTVNGNLLVTDLLSGGQRVLSTWQKQ